MKAELESAILLIDVFDSAIHIDDFPEFDRSFSWMFRRAKFAIRQIVEHSQLRQNYN